MNARVSRPIDRAEEPPETPGYGYETQLEPLPNVKEGVPDVVTSKKPRVIWRPTPAAAGNPEEIGAVHRADVDEPPPYRSDAVHGAPVRDRVVHGLMCLPMFLAAGLLVLAGAGTAALVLALSCALMMVAIVVFAACDRGDR